MKKFYFLIYFFLSGFFNLISSQTATLEATLKLIDYNGIKIPYQNGMPLPSFEKQKRIIIDLKGEWKKKRFNASDNITLSKRDLNGYNNLIAEAEGKHLPDYDDSAWESKTLPAVENTMTSTTKPPELYEDGVWYRRTFYVEDSLRNKFAKLIFYSVNYVADVWLNGKYVGYHEGGYTPFAFDVSDKLEYGVLNQITVRVDNPKWGTRKDIVPFTVCDWFNYTGIIQDVYLEFSNPVSVIRTNIVPLDIEGNIQTTVVLSNRNNSSKNVTATIEIFEANITENNITSEFASDILGNKIQTGTFSTTTEIPADSISVWRTQLKIPNPRIWSPKEPDLYVMKVSLITDNKIVDEFYTQFGIRKVEVKDNKLILNNKIYFLPGVARHEDHPVYGRSLPLDIIYSDLEIVKSLNVKYLRTAHYPNHLYTYLIADRLGLAIMEEIPVWWFDNAEEWQIQNNQRHIHEQMFREMVFRDFNRPSIIMWSTNNECKEITNRQIFNNKIKVDLITNYPDGRLLTQSSAANNPGANDPTQSPLDIAGWTMYFGIFYGKAFDYYGGTLKFLLDAKNSYPKKPIIDTEFGYWSKEDGTEEQTQIKVLNETFNAFKFFLPYDESGKLNDLNGCLAATTWWTVFDWYQNRTGGWQTMGLYSMDRRTAKPVASALKYLNAPFNNIDGILNEIDETEVNLREDFELYQNYPNPFNSQTIISYRLSKSGYVSIKVYDILGREVATLTNEVKQPGKHEIKFDASKLSSGIYFCKLSVNNQQQIKKIILIK
ncbi:glycoside hydrolase family 2 TIM barrel-domain containing protein [Rosettibacter firmus]|uniref:glycoside hydrolase family 2 TIM barrel-domain containing protein n=1 Tax=Rosettibacter firmus TaxID=3111522 RepID=UPI00336BF685